MKTRLILIALAIMVVTASVSAITYNGAPQLINYQGKLTDGAGNPVADGPHAVQFRIWDDTTLSGPFDLLWDSGPVSVTTDKGLFTIKLGTPPQPSLGLNVFYDTSIFLGITVGADPEIAPRSRLVSVPFAMSSQFAKSAQSAGTAYYLDPSTMPAAGTISVPVAGTVSTSAATLGSFTVQVPGNGYLTINMSGLEYINADANSTNSLITNYVIGLNTIPASFSGATFINPYVTDPDNFNSDNQTPAYSINVTYPVIAGPNTFYIVGATSNASYALVSWSNAMVTVLFTPGTLTITSPAPANSTGPQKQQ